MAQRIRAAPVRAAPRRQATLVHRAGITVPARAGRATTATRAPQGAASATTGEGTDVDEQRDREREATDERFLSVAVQLPAASAPALRADHAAVRRDISRPRADPRRAPQQGIRSPTQ